MEMMGFFCVIFVGILLSKWDVESFELENFELGSGNVSFLESIDANPPPGALMVPLTLIQGAAAKGAVCLDGSLPGYHFHPGFGSGANNWIVNLEGGGWCNNVKTCVYRKTTGRGSSNYFTKLYPFTGILSNKAEENPDFYNWNRVRIRYCDGASFAGEGENKAAGLLFRGQRIWQAAMEEILSRGMRNAKQALLSGCSAGGHATILHCDEFRALFPTTTKVKCVSDAGLFMDVKDVGGGHTIRDFYAGVVSLQGVAKNLPKTCTNHLDPTSCFFPQNLIANIKTPIFFLNAAYDSWQVSQSLVGKADPNGTWKSCKLNIHQCSPSQVQALQGLRGEMLNAVKVISAQSGFFINSCLLHCQTELQPKWLGPNSPAIGGKEIAKSVGDW